MQQQTETALEENKKNIPLFMAFFVGGILSSGILSGHPVDESMILSARRWMASSDSAWAFVRPWCQMGEQCSRIGLIVGVGVIEDLTF